MKTLKKYYFHLSFLALIFFGLAGAYYSAPMLPPVEIEFKSDPVHKNFISPPEPAPVDKDIRAI